MSKQTVRRLVAGFAALSLVAAACGSDAEVNVAGITEAAVADNTEDAPTIAVTTNILGDVVGNLVGDLANVETIMPVGADPHDFQPSAQQIALVGDADALIINGAFFEEGLWDTIEAAEGDGISVHHAIDAVETLEFAEGDSHGHDDEEGEEHDDEEGEEHDDEEGEEHDDEEGDEHGHEEGGADPHFFTDPVRMAVAVEGIAAFLIETVEGIDAESVQANADSYVAELEALDAEVTEVFAGLSDEQRVLITNHEVFGYFADQYDFEVVGAVIPSGSTLEGADGEALTELVHTIEDEGVPAIFSDVSASDELINTIADEVGDISVVELFTESLGDADSDGATYIDMVRTNANRMADALGS